MRLLALQGREAEASAAIASAIGPTVAGGQGLAAAWAHWSAAVLYNGLARYEEAVSPARQATSDSVNPPTSMWALPELVEAAARAGQPELARDALERLAESTQPSGTDWALGIEARCRALLSDGPIADELYREAVARFSRTRLHPELARAHLLHGEWLRRRVAGSTRASSYARLTRCWSRSGWRRSRSAHGRSSRRPVRRCAGGRSRRATIRPRRSGRSPAGRDGLSIRRSVSGRSSAPGPWNGIAQCVTASSVSIPAGSSGRAGRL